MSELLQPLEGQCAFFLPKKKRFCRFRPNQGQKYCAEHACVLGVELERKRVICPLNSKHTCYADSLDKHLKKCNSRKTRTEVYYEEGLNGGTDDDDDAQETQVTVKATDTGRLNKIIEKVNQLYNEHIGSLEEEVKSHECLKEDLCNPSYRLSALRHRRQQASLIGQLESLGLLEPGYCYVELGAGKGQLSHWVRKAVSRHDDATFLLVDRSSIRYKVDGLHKEDEKVKFERIKMDIEHLNLSKVPVLANSHRPMVAIGKHLCGAATDLTLRCLMHAAQPRSLGTSPSEPSAKRPRLAADAAPLTELQETAGLSASATDRRLEQIVTSCTLKCTGIDAATDALSNPLASVTQTDVLQASTDVFPNSCANVTQTIVPHGQKDAECILQVEPFSHPPRDGIRKREETKCKKENTKSDTIADSVERKTASAGLTGVLIALCCHHQCTWKAYVGKDFIRRCGFTASDFALLSRLTSWAVCGWKDRDGSFSKEKEENDLKADTTDMSASAVENAGVDGDEEHDTEDLVNTSNLSTSKQLDTLQLTEKQKETVGWKCKRLIDYGRVLYLRQYDMNAKLKIYVDSQQTPENVALVAVPT